MLNGKNSRYVDDGRQLQEGYCFHSWCAGRNHEETDEGYSFTYESVYCEREDAVAASLTLPLRTQPYLSKVLFPFFDGLIPEGWLLHMTQEIWKLDRRDRFGVLLSACRDCIGDVSIIKEE